MAPRKKPAHELAEKKQAESFCARCGKKRSVTSTKNAAKHCESCRSIIAHEARKQTVYAPCLVSLHKIERWHQYDRLTMLSSNR